LWSDFSLSLTHAHVQEMVSQTRTHAYTRSAGWMTSFFTVSLETSLWRLHNLNCSVCFRKERRKNCIFFSLCKSFPPKFIFISKFLSSAALSLALYFLCLVSCCHSTYIVICLVVTVEEPSSACCTSFVSTLFLNIVISVICVIIKSISCRGLAEFSRVLQFIVLTKYHRWFLQ